VQPVHEIHTKQHTITVKRTTTETGVCFLAVRFLPFENRQLGPIFTHQGNLFVGRKSRAILSCVDRSIGWLVNGTNTRFIFRFIFFYKH